MDDGVDIARRGRPDRRPADKQRAGAKANPTAQGKPDAGVFDRLPLGIILVDGRAHLHFMNRAAAEIVARDDGIRVARGRLCAASGEETSALRELVRRAARPLDGEALGRDGAMTLSRPSLKTPLSVVTMSLPADGDGAPERRPGAAVFVSDPERKPELRREALVSLYGLTKAEARLVEALARGGGLELVAAGLGITRETARTHLRRVFSKTNTHRQSELVRLVLCGPAAVRG